MEEGAGRCGEGNGIFSSFWGGSTTAKRRELSQMG